MTCVFAVFVSSCGKVFFIWSRIYWTTWSWGDREHSFCEWREGKEGGREKRGGRERREGGREGGRERREGGRGEREGGRGDREGGRERGRERARDWREGKRGDGKRDILISDLQYVSILADTDIHAEGLRNSLRSIWRVPLDIPRCKGCGLHLRQGKVGVLYLSLVDTRVLTQVQLTSSREPSCMDVG